MSNHTIGGKDALLDALERDVADSAYYVFMSKYTEWGDPDEAPDDGETDRVEQEARDEMIFAKRVTDSDVKRMIARNAWTTGTVYDAFDDHEDMNGLAFAVMNSSRDVYLCIDNAGGAESTSEPSTPYGAPFVTADGYTWKYLYGVSEEAMEYATANSIPLDYTQATSYYEDGAVEFIRVEASGSSWPQSETVTVSSVASNNSFVVSGLESSANGHYVDFGVYAQDGPAAGFVTRITSYLANSSGQYVTTAHGNTLVEFGTGFLVSPAVTVEGDGTGLTAYCEVGSGGEVETVRVVSSGSGYTWAGATVSCNGIYADTATLRPIVSPRGGHGADLKRQLKSDVLRMSVSVSPVDAPLTSYRRIGLMRDPSDYDGNACTASKLRPYWTATSSYAPSISYPPTSGEVINGQTSGASATVITANSTQVVYGDLTGEFQVGEAVIGADSSSIVTFSLINTPTVDVDSGEVLFIESFDPIQRQNTSSDRISVEFRT